MLLRIRDVVQVPLYFVLAIFLEARLALCDARHQVIAIRIVVRKGFTHFRTGCYRCSNSISRVYKWLVDISASLHFCASVKHFAASAGGGQSV